MYQSPVSADAPAQEAPLAELPEEDVVEIAYDEGNHRLREAHLQNGQAETSALFAPYFAASGIGSAILIVLDLFGNITLPLLIGWFLAVASAHSFICRRAVAAGSAAGSRSAKLRPQWQYVAEAAGLAILWSSLPTYAFATQPHAVQVMLGGAVGAMIIAAIALSAVPMAAMAWICILKAAICVACF